MTETPQPPTHPQLDALREAVQSGLPVAIADLGGLVRIPSVSWDGFDAQHVHDSAAAVKTLARGSRRLRLGRDRDARRSTTTAPASPAVLATRAAKNGKPTILLYAHHDVQPPGNDDDWESPPFEPTVRGDRLYGRGAADDKAGVMAHVAAIRALVETVGPDFDLGLVAFIEGEEEFGSRSFANFLAKHRDAARRRRHRRRRLRQLGHRDPGAHGRPARQRDLQAHGLDARPRLALRHVRGSGARRDARDDPPARHPARRGRLGRRRRAHLPRGATRPSTTSTELARGGGAPRGRDADRQRHHPRRGSGTSRRSRSRASTRPPWSTPRTPSCRRSPSR